MQASGGAGVSHVICGMLKVDIGEEEGGFLLVGNGGKRGGGSEGRF